MWREWQAEARQREELKEVNATQDSGENALVVAFRKTKERRSKAEANDQRSEENRGDAEGWSKEDQATFLEVAKNTQGVMGDEFLVKVQDRLPHMLHSDIIENRRKAYAARRSENRKEEPASNEGKEPDKRKQEKRKKRGTKSMLTWCPHLLWRRMRVHLCHK